MAGPGTWLRGLFGSTQDPNAAPDVLTTPPAGSGPVDFAQAGNDFAVAMYTHLRQRPGNLFFSPFSMRTALGMACAGARGATATQMGATLRFPPGGEDLHAATATIIRRLNAGGDGRYELSVANSLWGQEGAAPLGDFLDLVERHYGGALNFVDFARDPDAAGARINGWVEDRTRRRIRDLIAPGTIGPLTRLVLVNAVYFKGSWVLRFDADATSVQPFHLEDGKVAQAPLMRQQEGIRYLQARGYQAVEMDYLGGDLSMLVLLPDRKDGLPQLEATLSARMLHDCAERMHRRQVKLFLPRFKVTWGALDVRDALTALGMTVPFTREADFSGINGCRPPDPDAFNIGLVLHKAFVEVNERGTEAAAATVVGVYASSAMTIPKPVAIPVFRADHPFLFAIRERSSGMVLFLGRVANPTLES